MVPTEQVVETKGGEKVQLEKRIFPGGYVPTLRQMMDIVEGPGLSVLDVENIRLHYALTLEHWLQRYEAHLDQVRESFDEFFVRAWRLYLAASIANFRAGQLHLYQMLFARPGKNDIDYAEDGRLRFPNPFHSMRLT